MIINSVHFAPDGRTLVSASWDNKVRLWNIERGEQIQKLEGHTDEVYSVAFAPNGSAIVSGSGDGTVMLWKAVID